MKKHIISFFLTILSFNIYCQSIVNIIVEPNDATSVNVRSIVDHNYGMDFLSHEYIINGSEITLKICFKVYFTTVYTVLENDINIPIESPNDYVLNIEIYKNIINECDYSQIIDSATMEFSTPLTEMVSLSTSDIQNSLENQIQLFPNPTNGFLFIDNKSSLKILSVSLSNIFGSKLFSIKKTSNIIDLRNVNLGVYIVNIETNKGRLTKRLIKL